jgi:hypothetical protein
MQHLVGGRWLSVGVCPPRYDTSLFNGQWFRSTTEKVVDLHAAVYVYVSHAHVLYVHTQLISLSLSLSLVLPHTYTVVGVLCTYVSLQVMHACTCVQRQLLYSSRRRRTQFNSQACVSTAFWLLVVTYCLLVTEQKKTIFFVNTYRPS